MDDWEPPPHRVYPSPAAQRRSDEHWKARSGLVLVVLVFLAAAVVTLRLVRGG